MAITKASAAGKKAMPAMISPAVMPTTRDVTPVAKASPMLVDESPRCVPPSSEEKIVVAPSDETPREICPTSGLLHSASSSRSVLMITPILSTAAIIATMA